MRALIVLACLLLSGCASMMEAQHHQLTAQDKSACGDYGYQPGTDAFAACMQKRDEMRQQSR